MAEKFPNLKKETYRPRKPRDIKIHTYIHTYINPKKLTERYIIIKMSKVKEEKRVLKTAREKQLVMYRALSLDNERIFQEKFCRPAGGSTIYSKCYKKIISNTAYSTQQIYLKLKER